MKRRKQCIAIRMREAMNPLGALPDITPRIESEPRDQKKLEGNAGHRAPTPANLRSAPAT